MKPVIGVLLTSCLALSLSAARADAGLQAYRAFVATQKSIAGDFVQSSAGKNKVQTGQFALAKPASFRWATQKPFEQLLMSDGKTLTQWDADLNQATVRSAGDLLSNTPAALLLGDRSVEQQFGLVDAGMQDGLAWVQATPKSKDSQFKTIKLGFKEGVPALLLAQDAFGGTSQIELKNIHYRAIAASQFQFTPPKGADVVRM